MEKSRYEGESCGRSDIIGLLLLSGWGTAVAIGLVWVLKETYTKLFILLLMALAGCASSPSSDSECDYSKRKVAKLQKRATAGDTDNQFQVVQFRSDVSDTDRKPDTMITIKDVKVDVRPINPYDPKPHSIFSHEHSLKISVLVGLFSINKKTTLIDTDWYEYKKRKLYPPNLASADKQTLKEALETVSVGITDQLLDRMHHLNG